MNSINLDNNINYCKNCNKKYKVEFDKKKTTKKKSCKCGTIIISTYKK